MKFLFLLIAFTSTINLVAQNWCGAGAKWSYDYIWFNQRGYVECSYEKDTVIQSQSCNKISVWRVRGHYSLPQTPMFIDSSFATPFFTFSRNDTVFFWQDSVFTPVYYWGANVGDTLVAKYQYACPDTQVKTVVDSTGIISINNDSLRFYRAITVKTSHAFPEPSYIIVVEKIGAITDYLLPNYHCITEPEYMNLMCYEDDSLGLYKRSSICKHVFTGLTETPEIKNIFLYPNPVEDVLHIEMEESIGKKYAVVDCFGRSVLEGELLQNNILINVKKLSSGTYNVIINDNKNAIVKRLFVKH